ncbi:MAG: hypothetical protein GW945_01125 [Candidatus Pacebacteria bacterium]|nr:hypothetical protein [Candidatus Paceibacterota bacterium]
MPDSLLPLIQLLQEHLVLYLPFLLIAKMSGILFPLIPGGFFTFSAIPVIGWIPAYLIDLTGSLLAANIAYTLAERHGEKIILKLFGERTLQFIQKIKARQSRALESAFVLRLAGSGLLSDALIWSAPLLKLPRIKFLIGYHAAHIISTAPLFFVTEKAIEFDQTHLLLPLIIVALTILYIFRGRYFEKTITESTQLSSKQTSLPE